MARAAGWGWIRAGLTALLLFAVAGSGEARAAAREPVLTPLVAEVMALPWLVQGSDGQGHLVYEIQISNVTPLVIRLEDITVRNLRSGQTLATFGAAAIRGRFGLGGSRSALTRVLRPWESGVLFVDVSIPRFIAVPEAIAHQLRVTLDADKPAEAREVVLDVARMTVKTEPPVVLGPPLRGRNYVAADSCCDTFRHVKALLTINGRFALAQRFAIDWEQTDAQNRIFVGDSRDVRSYFIYGEPVIAVADGPIVTAVDGYPNQIPHDPGPVTLAEADGNHVLQKVGEGAYVLYAHMRPGSVRTRVVQGQRVFKGQVIGLVGNSGNTIAPHLHLHVVSGPSGLVGNGIPYVFEQFRIRGFDHLGTADFDRAERLGTPLAVTPISPPSYHRSQLPLDLVIVDWLN